MVFCHVAPPLNLYVDLLYTFVATSIKFDMIYNCLLEGEGDSESDGNGSENDSDSDSDDSKSVSDNNSDGSDSENDSDSESESNIWSPICNLAILQVLICG